MGERGVEFGGDRRHARKLPQSSQALRGYTFHLSGRPDGAAVAFGNPRSSRGGTSWCPSNADGRSIRTGDPCNPITRRGGAISREVPGLPSASRSSLYHSDWSSVPERCASEVSCTHRHDLHVDAGRRAGPGLTVGRATSRGSGSAEDSASPRPGPWPPVRRHGRRVARRHHPCSRPPRPR